MAELTNSLAAIRKARGLRAAALAEAAGVTRQTIYAIESGSYLPNTAVALRLARALGVSVEDVFALESSQGAADARKEARMLHPALEGDPVHLCTVGERLVAVPASPVTEFLPNAAAIYRGGRGAQGRVELLDDQDSARKAILIAGCDPALSLLASAAADAGVTVRAVPASSRKALGWLKQGFVHIAGSHLEDARTGEFNVPIVKRNFGNDRMAVVTFARWEEGWVLARGNPKHFRAAEDLARKDIRLRNRDLGSGARSLLDRMIEQAGLEAASINGYDTVASGHLSAVRDVALGSADCCVATEAAARAFHLDFLPVKTERYDFVFRRELLETNPMQVLLEVLQRATLRQKLRTLAGYDIRDTGTMVE